MPLDIATDCVLDPMLADKFNVIRRAETVDAHGRSTTVNTAFPNVVGVVNMAEDEQLLRQEFPEMQYATRVISIVCKFRLQTAVRGYQPDLVVWRGNSYVVRAVDPYPQYGNGFYEATASAIDLADTPL